MALLCATPSAAQRGSVRLMAGVGVLYEDGLDLTVAVERVSRHHNAWEFFLNGYLKWSECDSDGEVCSDSFWHNYNTWSAGIAYKPCVVRGRNNHGNLRVGGSLGSDTEDFLGGIHLGYEHNYALRGGWLLFWQAKTDIMIEGEDLFRTGVVLGFKLPL